MTGFEEGFIPVMKPRLPLARDLFPYLERIDESRFYANNGPLVREFEMRLGDQFDLSSSCVATVTNGTMALSVALVASGAVRGRKCLVPSWTFVATAAAILAVGMEPHFADVSADTWMLDPDTIRNRPDLHEIGAVMPVSAFGAPVNVAAWDAFTADTGIPVVIDGAASFDTVSSVAISKPGRSAMMVSFHATKVLGIGEGAAVISRDEAMIRRVRQICAFGVWGDLREQILGYNGKLSEYHAAVGLASLDAWPKRRQIVGELTRYYAAGLAGITGVLPLPTFAEGWVSCYCLIASESDGIEFGRGLARLGIESRRWWGEGIHDQPAYVGFSRDDLPNTKAIAHGAIGLPFYHDLSHEQIDRVLAGVRAIAAASIQ